MDRPASLKAVAHTEGLIAGLEVDGSSSSRSALSRKRDGGVGWGASRT
jgi:hypothetical protein